ncbi:MAG: hypothetical protein NC218_02330 [Acetobacter sp.]|nr:hypothetical protein [Acetobacter sp.]
MSDLVPKDQVEVELEKAKLLAKKQRAVTIGSLLDKSAEVLEECLDDDTPANAGRRMRAAEVAINLYIQQESMERQDRALDIQAKRLELEEAKLALPGGPLFTQNNVYLQGGAPPQQGEQLSDEEKQAQLLARKQAQDALLKQYLPPQVQDTQATKDTQATVVDIPQEDVHLSEDTTGDDKK